MVWTTTPPIAAGWYWFRRNQSAAAECVEVLDPEYDSDPEMRVQVVGRDDCHGIRDRRFNPGVGEWAGPIEPPT